jgi:putative oxidoreductase
VRRLEAIDVVRILTAALLLVHGIARVSSGGVAPFGEFLAGQGFPAGRGIAWILTAVEIVGALLLIAGRFVPILCAWFIAELFAGIVMVHWKEGWFVVGGGRNGIEYSVLLIACLAAAAWDSLRRGRSPARA